jgi:hypothetical protein
MGGRWSTEIRWRPASSYAGGVHPPSAPVANVLAASARKRRRSSGLAVMSF